MSARGPIPNRMPKARGARALRRGGRRRKIVARLFSAKAPRKRRQVGQEQNGSLYCAALGKEGARLQAILSSGSAQAGVASPQTQFRLGLDPFMRGAPRSIVSHQSHPIGSHRLPSIPSDLIDSHPAPLACVRRIAAKKPGAGRGREIAKSAGESEEPAGRSPRGKAAGRILPEPGLRRRAPLIAPRGEILIF